MTHPPQHDDGDWENDTSHERGNPWLGIGLYLAIVLFGVAACSLLAGCAAPRIPEDVDRTAVLPGQQVPPPFGFIALCVRDARECEGGSDVPRLAAITPEAWEELSDVNEHVNALPRRDEPFNATAGTGTRDFWQAGPGDCEDLVLEKQRRLTARGWPAEALLVALVREWTGDAHAVLLVLTDRGEFVLDSKNRLIDRAEDASYQWIKLQSPRRPYIWLSGGPEALHADAVDYPPLGVPAPFLVAVRERGNSK